MGTSNGDDLRRKFLHTYDQGEGTLEDLAGLFSVSLGWAKKISAQRNRSGQAERVPHHPGASRALVSRCIRWSRIGLWHNPI